MTGDEPAGGTINLTKEPVPARPGPAWLVVPARIIALIVVLPLRLVHDLFVQIGRGMRSAWQRLARLAGRLLRGVWLALYGWLLAPLGRLVAAIGRGTGALLNLLIVRPLRWLAVVAILGLLRQLGALLDFVIVRPLHWFAVVVVLGFLRQLGALLNLVIVQPLRWLAVVAILGLLRQLGALLELVIVRPLRWLGVVVILGFLRWFGRGSGRFGRWVYRVLIVPLGRMLEFVLLRPLRALGRGLVWLIGVLVVMPVVLLWRYVVRPSLLALAWLGRGTLAVLAAGLHAFAAGVVWSWRLLGRCLGWLGRVLFVLPAQALWRYVLAPVGAGIVGTWRLTSRVLRWLWRTLVVIPVRVVIVAPARWVRTSVLRPIGHGVRAMWRVSVREPLSAARRTMRQASRDVRLTLRRAFRGR